MDGFGWEEGELVRSPNGFGDDDGGAAIKWEDARALNAVLWFTRARVTPCSLEALPLQVFAP